MEVADQWRREWAGTAEYGKVTERGITRRVARATEVLHASGPGARVSVMRTAYHSTAGPGIPASSYMLHSSRRILSSGFDLEGPPSLPSKPLEISSIPLDLSQDSNPEIENYKVTEPDDIDISEPSKWRGSSKASGIRMPSEESSSTDNASIIDLDSRSSNRNLHRKYSNDSENSEIHFKRYSSRLSPLLDSPVTLSTLKYKSLLNNSSEWNTRRKSYSFEDTPPIIESPFYNETLAMESSTDSGICKSSEIVNDQVDENMNYKYVVNKEKNTGIKDESFQDWLSKNRTNSFYRNTKFKSQREHEVVIEDPVENNISLPATSKVTINLPITVGKGYEGLVRNIQINDENQRKVKKVEFCKTELHFAAESGKVNIIATDEKPPPSNDFRKRRSVFLPLHNMPDKPITLFGDKTKQTPELNYSEEIFTSESIEFDENTAATKSILKNKIPKPKPYLLGENMAFRLKDDVQSEDHQKDSVASVVSFINKQLQADEQSTKKNTSREIHLPLDETRTINQGPNRNDHRESGEIGRRNSDDSDIIHTSNTANKNSQGSPPQSRLKTRRLRESDMTYFGVKTSSNTTNQKVTKNRLSATHSIEDDLFYSVRLIQKIAQSVSNSEPESEDSPEYQNLPLNTSFAPIPTPRHRLKYNDQPNEIDEINISKPTNTREENVVKESVKRTCRSTKSREQYEALTAMSRSRSEPRKCYSNSLDKSTRLQQTQATRCTRNKGIDNKDAEENIKKITSTKLVNNFKELAENDVALYVNLNLNTEIGGDKIFNRRGTKKLAPEKKLSDSNSKDDINIRDLRSPLNIRNTHTNIKSPIKTLGIARKGTENHENDINERQRRNGTAQKKDDKKMISNSDMLLEGEEKVNKQHTKQSLARNNSTSKQEHRNRSSHRKVCANEINKYNTNSRENSLEKSLRKDLTVTDFGTRRASPEKKRPIREPLKIRDCKSDTESAVRRIKSTQPKTTERNILSKAITKTFNESTPKRNEYVINYDDKDGAMSSVCKMKSGTHLSRRRKIVLDKAKDISKDNKYYLQQLDYHQEDLNSSKYTNKKWKAKVRVQRSCQLF